MRAAGATGGFAGGEVALKTFASTGELRVRRPGQPGPKQFTPLTIAGYIALAGLIGGTALAVAGEVRSAQRHATVHAEHARACRSTAPVACILARGHGAPALGQDCSEVIRLHEGLVRLSMGLGPCRAGSQGMHGEGGGCASQQHNNDAMHAATPDLVPQPCASACFCAHGSGVTHLHACAAPQGSIEERAPRAATLVGALAASGTGVWLLLKVSSLVRESGQKLKEGAKNAALSAAFVATVAAAAYVVLEY